MDTPEKTRFPDWLRNGALIASILGLAGTSVGWYVQYQQTIEAQRLAYKLSTIEGFKQSGAQLDEVTTKFFDALADGKDAEEIREEFLNVYRKHVTLAEADREVLGSSETDQYLQALSVLRDQVSSSEDAAGAGARIEALADVIARRRTLNEEVIDG